MRRVRSIITVGPLVVVVVVSSVSAFLQSQSFVFPRGTARHWCGMIPTSLDTSTQGNGTRFIPYGTEMPPTNDVMPVSAIHHFRQLICALQAEHGQQTVYLAPATTTTTTTILPQDGRLSEAVHIKSIVLEISGTALNQYVLAILKTDDRIDVTALEEGLARRMFPYDERGPHKLSLAAPDRVSNLCGFTPGTVPPIGLLPPPVLTFVETSVGHGYDNNNQEKESDKRLDPSFKVLLYGGGGVEDQLRFLTLDLLLRQPRVEMTSFRLQTTLPQSTVVAALPSENDPAEPSSTLPMPSLHEKPFFSVAPPETDLCQVILRHTELPIPFQPTMVQIVGRLSGVRRMAKLLVFCDLAPLSGQHCPLDLPWRSPLTGEEMAVQLVAGKTLVHNAGGSVPAALALRQLRVGQIIVVHGRTNVQQRESLHNWSSKRSLDIVIHSFQILQPSSAGVEDRPIPSRTVPTSTETTIPPIDPTRTIPEEAYMKLTDLYDPIQSSVLVVDSLASVHQFSHDVSQLLLDMTTVISPDESNDVALIGMDCEWLPSFYLASPTEPQPVLVLQISLHRLQKVYLLDLQTLLRPLLSPSADVALTPTELAMSEALGNIFATKRLVKVGFQITQDLRQLAASYPHMTVFRSVHSILDTPALAKKIMHINKQRNSRTATSSLSQLTKYFLGKSLNKEQQCSDWSSRPLSPAQIEYAALDAVVTPVIAEQLLRSLDVKFFPSCSKMGRWKDDKSFSNMLTSVRFIFLDPDSDVHAIRKLNAKRIVGEPFVVTQRWSTGTEAPNSPTTEADGQPYTDRSGILRYPSQVLSLDLGAFHHRMDSLLGLFVGRSKDRCVLPFLTPGLPIDARLDFPQRSGFVELQNAVFLFVNIPASGNRARFPNEWLEDGQILTWYIRASQWKQGTSNLAKKMQDMDTIHGRSAVSLFVRIGNKGSFLCCGRCRVVSVNDSLANSRQEPDEEWNLVTLHLILEDYTQLQCCHDFSQIVNNPDKVSIDYRNE